MIIAHFGKNRAKLRISPDMTKTSAGNCSLSLGYALSVSP